MKKLKYYSKGEVFFLYWNGHLQPIGRTIADVYQYIFLNYEQLDRFKVRSNYRENVPIDEILNPANK